MSDQHSERDSRMMSDRTPEYESYHKRVVDAVRKNLTARWPPTTDAEREHLDRQVAFFDLECDYHDAFARADDPEEVADENIDAAEWS